MKRSAAILALATAACTAQTANTPETTSETSMTESATPATIEAFNKRFLEAYAAGDATTAAAHYAPDGVWYLTNGAPIAGRDAITGFLAQAHADGAGNFVLQERAVHEVGDVRYSQEQFAFDLAPGKTVRGTRFGLWKLEGDAPTLVRDAWVPATEAPADLHAAITAQTAGLAAAYNGGGEAALQALYTDDASMVLSNGTVIAGDALRPMLKDTAAMDIKDMRFGAQTVYAAGDAAYSIGSFDVTLPMPDGDVPLAGERLLLWQKTDAGWKVGLEISWPRAATSTAAVEAGGMKFTWEFRDDRLVGRVQAPSRGWVAVGFNNREDLAGTRLVMARVTADGAVAEEHFADPPNHQDIRKLGAPTTILRASGSENGGTTIEFELDPRAVAPSDLALTPGMDVWVTLAYSESDDFQHHSRFRTAKPAKL